MPSRLARKPIIADFVGGISLTGLMIPEAVAYSAIAGLPVAFGVTGAIAGPLAYALIGRSRLAVVSATSGAAALLAAAIGSAAIPGISRTDCAVALTILVGLFFLVGAGLRVAALTSFISRAVLHGFGFGLAVTIALRQLPALVGMHSVSGAPVQILARLAQHLGDIHLPSLVLGVGALLMLRLSRHLKFTAGGLVIIIASAAAMKFAGPGHWGIATVGQITLTPALPTIPRVELKDWAKLAQLAFPIAVVLLAESWATIRSLAAARGDTVSPQKEIAALGLANIASGLLRGLPVGAGFSISNANAQAGTADRLGAVFGAVSIFLVALTAANAIALIPEPVLAAIVISALTHALSIRPFIALFRLGRDQWVALVAAAAVLVLGLINGLLVAVALSLLTLLRRLAHPHLSELGRSGTHDFVDCSTHSDAKTVPGMLIVRPDAPLFFGNADAVLGAISQRATALDSKTIILSLEESDDFDSSTIDALSDFCSAMAAQKRALFLARVHDRVRTILVRGGLKELASTGTFSVDDAVKAASTSNGPETRITQEDTELACPS